MDNKPMSLTTKIIGILGFGLLAVFLVRGRKENNKGENPIQGLNMNVDPSLVIDSVLPLTKIPKHFQNPVGNGLKKFISGYMSER